MAWQWSHTAEAYENAFNNLRELPRDKLDVIFAEWRAAGVDTDKYDSEAFNQRKYARALAYAKELDTEELCDAIWNWAENAATCDNGGYNAWLCPSGCGCHCVSFDRNTIPAIDATE